MDSRTFDEATRSLAAGASRRSVLRGLAAGALAVATGGAVLADANAKQRHGKRRGSRTGHDGGHGKGRVGGNDERLITGPIGFYVTSTYTKWIDCPPDEDGDPQTCDLHWELVRYNRPTSVKLELIASKDHCSDVRYTVYYSNAQGNQNWTTMRLQPGGSSGVQDLGAGITWLHVHAKGFTGGCNTGAIGGWGATAKVTTPRTAILM